MKEKQQWTGSSQRKSHVDGIQRSKCQTQVQGKDMGGTTYKASNASEWRKKGTVFQVNSFPRKDWKYQ